MMPPQVQRRNEQLRPAGGKRLRQRHRGPAGAGNSRGQNRETAARLDQHLIDDRFRPRELDVSRAGNNCGTLTRWAAQTLLGKSSNLAGAPRTTRTEHSNSLDAYRNWQSVLELLVHSCLCDASVV